MELRITVENGQQADAIRKVCRKAELVDPYPTGVSNSFSLIHLRIPCVSKNARRGFLRRLESAEHENRLDFPFGVQTIF